MCSVGFTFGWRSFGYDGALIPELRLGVVSVWWCRGTLWDALSTALGKEAGK